MASLFFIGPALVLIVWLDGYVLGIAQGAVLCVFAVVTTASFFAQTNAVGQMSGAWGEEFTRDELTKARRRRLIWGSVHGLAIASGDIDHLVLTRNGRLIAIDSKRRNDPDRSTLIRDAHAAASAARHAKQVLRSLHDDRDVTPLVALWGAGRRQVPADACVEGVAFIDGGQLNTWLSAHANPPIDRAAATELLDRLNDFKRRVQPPDSR